MSTLTSPALGALALTAMDQLVQKPCPRCERVAIQASTLHALGTFALMAPFLMISLLFAYYFLRRAIWKGRKHRDKSRLGFCPSTYAFGMVLQLVPLFYRPSVEFVIEARQVEEVEEDDQGDPESPVTHLDLQLKRIRKGEPIDTLKLWL